MSSNDWQLEMHRLLEIFERESINSLRSIKRYFVALDRPFDEKFRRYFLNVSNIRLDSSFRTVQLEQCAENTAQVTPYSNAPTQGSENASNANNPGSPANHVGSLNTPRDGDLLKVNVENNEDETIEVPDSDDEGDGNQCGMQASNDSNDSNGSRMEPNASLESNNGTDSFDGEHINQDSNNENGVGVIQIRKSGIEMEGLPSDGHDANNAIVRSCDAPISESLENQNQSRPSSSNKQKQSKHADGKRFKCNDCAFAARSQFSLNTHLLIHQGVKSFKCQLCDYAARRKYHLIQHQRVHEREKLLGIVRDPSDGLFKCTHCDLRFMKWHRLTVHLAKSHKNNQRLFNCTRCLRPFTQRTEKERHEIRCQNRHYECYLCKNYVLSTWSKLQSHMRTHSGVKPFQCAICHRCFRHTNTLKYHLNSVHSRIQA